MYVCVARVQVRARVHACVCVRVCVPTNVWPVQGPLGLSCLHCLPGRAPLTVFPLSRKSGTRGHARGVGKAGKDLGSSSGTVTICVTLG